MFRFNKKNYRSFAKIFLLIFSSFWNPSKWLLKGGKSLHKFAFTWIWFIFGKKTFYFIFKDKWATQYQKTEKVTYIKMPKPKIG